MSSISQKKVKISTGRNSFNNLIGNNDVNSLQKMFKKETKKMLFKHTLNESKKQNFQWYFKKFFSESWEKLQMKLKVAHNI